MREDASAASDHSVKGFLRLQVFLVQALFSKSDQIESLGAPVSESIGTPIYGVEDTPLETTSMELYCALLGCRLFDIKGKSHCLYQGLLLEPRTEPTGTLTRFGYLFVLQECSREKFETIKEPYEESDIIKHFKREEITIY